MQAQHNGKLPGVDSKSAMRIASVSLRQLNHWDRIGLISPSLAPARGSGSRRRYTAHDVVLLAVAGVGRSNGLPLARIREVVSALRAQPSEAFSHASLLLVPDSGRPRITTEPAGISDQRWTGMSAMLLRVGLIADRVRRLMANDSTPQVVQFAYQDQMLQAELTPHKRGGGFRATSKAYAGLEGHGPTPNAAIDDLRDRIASHKLTPHRHTTSASHSNSPTAPPAGASAWGGGW